MNAIKEYFGTAFGAKKAIMAGVDLIFISHTAGLAAEAAREIEKAVESGEIPISRIDDAVERILAYKKRHASPNVDTGKKIRKRTGAVCKVTLSRQHTVYKPEKRVWPSAGKKSCIFKLLCLSFHFGLQPLNG